MDVSLLEQLLAKPVAQKQQEIAITLPQTGEIQLQTKIVDKTNLGYDGSQLRRRLQRFEKIFRPPTLEKQEEVEETVAPEESIEAESTEESISPLPESTESTSIKPPPKKKLSKKIIIKPAVSKKSSKAITIAEEEEEEEDITTPTDLSLVINTQGQTLGERIPPPSEKILIQAPSYFLSNQKKFISFITNLFLPYRRQLLAEEKNISCQRTDQFSLLTHQKIVRDYLNVLTPYRGLLLFHGLGSGKTCSSIAIAEGFKEGRPIIIMTPAALRMNYIQELKKCGDILYKINQYWEFIPTEDNEPLEKAMSQVLSLPRKFIRENGGAWFINLKKKANYTKLNATHRKNIDIQINAMIERKYYFINYNGLRASHLKELKRRLAQPNLFDNAVVIIDEVHNFVSRIVNKLKDKKSLSMQLYNYLQKAENCRIVCLTGTPIINYPNELGILFNILRGNIVTYTLPLTINTQQKINEQKMKNILKQIPTLDYIRYQASLKQLVITRNPFGFINAPDERTNALKMLGGAGQMTNKKFIKSIIKLLEKNQISVNNRQITVKRDKALPDTLEGFSQWFINAKTGALKNQNIFKKRILGLTSHFRSPQETLMAQFNKATDMHIIEIPMSNYQLNLYEHAREGERKLEKEQAKRKGRRKKKAGKEGDIYEDSVSTYRIFSRAFCNFVFPGDIKRPLPQESTDVKAAAQGNLDEDMLDNATIEETIQNTGGKHSPDDVAEIQSKLDKTIDDSYAVRIRAALKALQNNSSKYLSKEALTTLSPKFLTILNTIEAQRGLHLVYSQFRTLEGIGIFKLVLEANGFAQFNIIKTKRGSWRIQERKQDVGKPKFILYTGTESTEEKEIVRNIFNSQWDAVPRSIRNQLKRISANNYHGEIAKVFMITAAGAEGITLRNVRYVHIMEPYWHPVRVEQVIGRARRICSHHDLPAEERKIEVFLYLMRFTEQQLTELVSSELKIKDISKLDSKVPLTSDQALFEISSIKEKINEQLLKAIKEAAIDCAVQMRQGGENLTCFAFTKPKAGKYAYIPELTGGDDDDIGQANKIKKTVKVVKIKYAGKDYIYNPETQEVYDLESYEITKTQPGAVPIVVGMVIVDPKTNKRIIRFN